MLSKRYISNINTLTVLSVLSCCNFGSVALKINSRTVLLPKCISQSTKLQLLSLHMSSKAVSYENNQKFTTTTIIRLWNVFCWDFLITKPFNSSSILTFSTHAHATTYNFECNLIISFNFLALKCFTVTGLIASLVSYHTLLQNSQPSNDKSSQMALDLQNMSISLHKSSKDANQLCVKFSHWLSAYFQFPPIDIRVSILVCCVIMICVITLFQEEKNYKLLPNHTPYT